MFNLPMGAVMFCVALAQPPALGANPALGQPPPMPIAIHKPTAQSRVADTCGLEAARRYTAGIASPTIREAVAKATGHTRIRWIKPGEAVTQDYRTDRLNVIIDDNGKILTMRCG